MSRISISSALGRASSAARRGFTLVELLVVVAMIAIIVGALTSSISSAQQRARIQKATSDVKVIAQAILASENFSKGGEYKLKEISSLTEADANSLDFLVGRGGTYQAGTDAELSVNINGRNINLTRSTNAVELEGLTVTLKGTFNEDSVPAEGVGQAASSAVTFSTVADSTELIDTIRTMVNDFNNALKSIHDAISTQPLEKSTSKHTKYEPLTDEDKADMSDSAVEAYEEKAKTGLLFNDSDLNTLYSRLTGIISGGALAQELREIGIEANYSTTTKLYSLSIDEDQLRSALEANTDKVASVFTRIADSDNGQAGGLMSQLKTQLDTYTSTSFTDPGILVKKAGTTKSATSLLKNDMLDELTAWDNKIETWQDRINTKIDYYTRMFTTLEKMTAQMNNQSSMFAGLMGY